MTPGIPRAAIRRAIADPGKVTPRQGNGVDVVESLPGWQARAVIEVLSSWLDGHEIVELPAVVESGVA